MRIEKFKVIQYIRELLIIIDKNMDNFPKKDIELKNIIRSNSYDLLEIAYEANTTQNIEYKKELLNRAVAKVKVIDFLLNLSFDKKLLQRKDIINFGNKMDDITKYLIGWNIINNLAYNINRYKIWNMYITKYGICT